MKRIDRRLSAVELDLETWIDTYAVQVRDLHGPKKALVRSRLDQLKVVRAKLAATQLALLSVPRLS